MLVIIAIDFNLVIETVGAPFFGKKGDRDGFSEAVDLQAGAANGVHDRGIMDNFDFDVALDSSII